MSYFTTKEKFFCRNNFLFLHTIGEFRLKALKAHYLSQGLVPHTHGHCGRIAPNALVLEDIKCIITFIMHCTEVGILLPGRIPGYKLDNIQLLPSSTTKRAVWKVYQDSSLYGRCTKTVQPHPLPELCPILSFARYGETSLDA